MSERQEKCSTCRFWQKVTDQESACGPAEFKIATDYPGKDADGYVEGGECHRNAPSVGSYTGAGSWPDNAQAVWPVTLPLDWCGEWQRIALPMVEVVLAWKVLSIRAAKGAARALGIYGPEAMRAYPLKDIEQLTSLNILEQKNCSERTLAEIQRVLHLHGLKLKDG